MKPETEIGKWFDKAVRGSEKPGHKYLKRVPDVMGGFHYVYHHAAGGSVEASADEVLASATQQLTYILDRFPKDRMLDNVSAVIQHIADAFEDSPNVAATYPGLGHELQEALRRARLSKAPAQPKP